jgi:hypothetical protein
MTHSFRRSLLWPLILPVLAIAVLYPRPELHLRRGPADDDDARKPHADNPAAAMAFRRLQWQDANGYIPPDGLIRAKQHVDEMRRFQAQGLRRAESVVTTSSWTWLGPGNIGGRVRAIVVNPTTPTTWLAGSVSGGIWQTTNSGASWTALDDMMANLAVVTIVMQPNTPTTIYAGTGEGFFSPDFEYTSQVQGAGIFKSTDGGAHWNQLASTNNPTFYYVNRLAISSDSSTLLAGTEYGVSRSTDGGTSFTSATGINDIVTDLAFHPTNSNLAVASSYSGNAWYSTNGGANWTAATGLPSGAGRVEITYAPSSPTTVYASVDTNSGTVYKSTNSGASYTTLTSSPASYLGGQGYYDNVIWVDPTSPSTIVVGGIDLWITRNGGASWSQISKWQNSPLSAHADHHAIVSLPGFNGGTNKTVLFGNDGGVYSTTNVYTVGSDGSNETGWTFQNHNLGITQYYGAAGNPSTGTIVGGTQDNGTLAYTTAGGAQGLTAVYGGDGGYTVADIVSNYFYGEYVYLQVFRSTNGGGTNSADPINGLYYNGSAYVCKATPYSIPDVCSGTNISVDQANFIAPMVLDPNTPTTLLAGGASLWRTTNAKAANTSTTGPSWASIKDPSGATGNYISAIAVASGNSNVCWVGYPDGTVYKTANCTATTPTWTEVDNNGLPGLFVTRVTIDATNNSRVYVSMGGFDTTNLWVTTNGGTTWASIVGNGATALPSVPVRDLSIDPGNPSVLYAGTEIGVFNSLDGGNTWGVAQDGPANVSVDQLFWMGSSLVAATWGRGLFTAPSAESDFTISVTPSSQTVTQGGSTTYTVNTTALGASAQSVALSVSGLPSGATFSFNPATVTAGGSSTLTVNTTASTATGTVTLTVTGTGAAPVHTTTTSLTVNSASIVLSVSKMHSGNFRQSESHAVYTVTVSNGAGTGPTSGTVTLTENLPSGLSLASAVPAMSGTGWSCSSNKCTRSDVLAGGASYPAITVLVNVASNAASSVTNSVTVSGGGSASATATDVTTVTALASVPNYKVGDVYPSTNDSAGNFGDGSINTLDLLATLRAVTGIPGSVPDVCSDRFDAMDSFPVDTTSRGGDGLLNTLDLLETLRRVANTDSSRPTRSPRTSCTTAAAAPQRVVPAVAEGVLEFGDASPAGDGWRRTPVYLRANVNLDLAGLSFSLGDVAPGNVRLRFLPANSAPSLVDTDIPGTLAVAWLNGWTAAAGARVLLGYVEAPASQAVAFFGASANASGTGRDVRVSWSPGNRRRR